MQVFSFDRDAASDLAVDFSRIYGLRPLRSNAGGMGFNHSFATWLVLQQLQPKLVVESGVWRGHSTWLIEKAAPQAQLFCFDPRPDRRIYTSTKATYVREDFSHFNWSGYDTSNGVAFFDDHQNCYERLKAGYWFGFRHFLFEDNFPCGEGDSYSIRHVMAGCGHPHMQMSRRYSRRPRQLLKRLLVEPLLKRLGAQQTATVLPNDTDAANLRRQLHDYCEVPPVALPSTTHWGTEWAGGYKCEQPIFDSVQLAADALGPGSESWSWDYGYLCYVALARGFEDKV